MTTLADPQRFTGRYEKIVAAVKSKDYSIHDISRLKAQKEGENYRLNMAFELGVDMGHQTANGKEPPERMLVLSAEKYEWHMSLSDLQAFDIEIHQESEERLLEVLAIFFSCQQKLQMIRTLKKLFDKEKIVDYLEQEGHERDQVEIDRVRRNMDDRQFLIYVRQFIEDTNVAVEINRLRLSI